MQPVVTSFERALAEIAGSSVSISSRAVQLGPLVRTNSPAADMESNEHLCGGQTSRRIQDMGREAEACGGCHTVRLKENAARVNAATGSC